jgi:hypothetical protein
LESGKAGFRDSTTSHKDGILFRLYFQAPVLDHHDLPDTSRFPAFFISPMWRAGLIETMLV